MLSSPVSSSQTYLHRQISVFHIRKEEMCEEMVERLKILVLVLVLVFASSWIQLVGILRTRLTNMYILEAPY
ncbi:uncharacterized protein K460DRAFT_36071 [Cucurbitaria berberidis CBS 394.84]|uniref:Uncharacterized protein n=1 Tax=Cucurbitaria berberidis CBS 394.84 TaxID=1168544 RepID=A0A9P4GUE3_9PLEO|nr:uncharacterized protein K460DRAFT_36071 [Cucurbitaria berberidis CBS 394.84]KAF1851502.1 hypothetical protein K460DRAFT_36071 [Cucurbitaria berberidis CBS 394.84]